MKNLFVILTATDEKVSPGIKVWILTSWSSKDKLKRREREVRTDGSKGKERILTERKEKRKFARKERTKENSPRKKENSHQLDWFLRISSRSASFTSITPKMSSEAEESPQPHFKSGTILVSNSQRSL